MSGKKVKKNKKTKGKKTSKRQSDKQVSKGEKKTTTAAPVEDVRALITANIYDVSTIPALEATLASLSKKRNFDFVASRELLKLYRLSSNAVNDEMVALILAQGLMTLPETNYLSSLYLIPTSVHKNKLVQAVVSLAACLENAQFVTFWAQRSQEPANSFLNGVPDFDKNVRSYIAQTVGATYQNLPAETMSQRVQIEQGKALNGFLKDHGFTVEGSTVICPLSNYNQFSSTAADEDLSMDGLSKLLTTLSAY